MATFKLEQATGAQVVCGVDEVGMGPLAGPVVAACAVVRRTGLSRDFRYRLTDSKQLSAAAREGFYRDMTERGFAVVGLGRASVEEIDRLNIYRARFLAMQRAFDELVAGGVVPDCALVDGNARPDLPCRVDCVVKGDARSLSIAAASVAAKVTRDRLMTDLAERFPGYGWETNMGYGTKAHRRALETLGPTEHHRRSFGPVSQLVLALGPGA